MASNRYRAVVALLDDPLNRVAVTRELLRRGKVSVMPPPVPVRGPDGSKWGWAFPTLRQVMKGGLPEAYAIKALDTVDCEIHVFNDGDHWFVTLLNDGGVELGPFDSSGTALQEAANWLKEEGHTILDAIPWDEDDITEFSLWQTP